MVDARGSTSLSDGWFTGARALSGANPDGRVRRVLLLTDGQANRGIIEPDELAAAAARFLAEGIRTSTFDLGDDFDEELLTRLAAEGGGHSYFIEQAVQIPDFFASELGEVLDVVARNVILEVVAGPVDRVTVLNPLQAEQDGGSTRVRLGDFVAEQEVTLLLAVEVAARPTGEVAALQCRVSASDGGLPALPMQVDWGAVTEVQDREQPVNWQLQVDSRGRFEPPRLLRAVFRSERGSQSVLRKAISARLSSAESFKPNSWPGTALVVTP